MSLFHYRNNGADFGRVLAGIQIPAQQKELYKTFLNHLSGAGYYMVTDETENPVYKQFLR